MLPFWLSIALLGLVQGALVALPRSPLPPLPARLEELSGRWWAIAPAASIVVVIVAVDLREESASFLTYLALVAVPPLAALALARLVRGGRPPWALAAPVLFVLAWSLSGAFAGEAAATALSGLACVSLGWLLATAVPARWLRRGVYAMAAIDAALVTADLLQGPNSVLVHAAPAAGLPRLQVAALGSARMGFGDLFVAGLAGCLLSAERRQARGALLVTALALSFDLLFFAVDTLPATVPVAVALAISCRRPTA